MRKVENPPTLREEFDNFWREWIYKFYESATSNKTVVFADGDATPNVYDKELFKTANTGATTITDFEDGYENQKITVVINDANTSIDFTGSNLKGNGGVDWSPSAGDHMTCVYDGEQYWYCTISEN